MKKYVLYDSIIDINSTSALVQSTNELFDFLKIKVPSLKNAPRDIGCESMALDTKAFHDANLKTLSLASQEKSDIVCADDSSFLSLNLTLDRLKKDEKFKAEAQNGYQINFEINIFSLVDFLVNEVGVSKIKKNVKNSFEKFNTALYLGSYQCQVSKYSDNSAYTKLFDAIGLKQIDYRLKNQVCGYEINDVNTDLSFKMAGSLMLDMFDNAADFVVISDARSFVMFDKHQKELEKQVGRDIGLSVFGLSELLLLAFGLGDKDKIGLNNHAVKTEII
jgi:succinate dehydrogenase / fumarate reductase cytochrome b subunit